ncbi:MAG: hypothetical protein GXP28_01665 [Planctomycetes bacterium]|nr:hypothetical protein [Planctomycetota bacterium]
MRPSKPRFQSVVAAGLLLLATTMTAAEGPDTSLIADSEVPSQESVADEILEIRQHLGGSIVSDRQSLQEFPPPSVEVVEATDLPDVVVQFCSELSGSQTTQKPANPEGKSVKSLRDAAWRLDQSAERLERSELYKQADALRNLAQQFRLDARAIRAPSGK